MNIKFLKNFLKFFQFTFYLIIFSGCTSNSRDDIFDYNTDNGDSDTGSIDANSSEAVMSGAVDRGNGLYTLEFEDDEHRWYFSCIEGDGGRITDFSIDGNSIIISSSTVEKGYGSIFWTSPQTAWNWPPPASINTDPFTALVNEEEHSITLTSGTVTVGGQSIIVTKKFSADLVNKGIVLDYSITNQDMAVFSAAPWEITRVYPQGLSLFKMGEGEITSGTMSPIPYTNINGVIFADNSEIAISGDYKLFSDGSAGWLAHTDGALVFIKSFSDTPLVNAATGESEIELYTNTDYEEVEVQGAYEAIQPGMSSNWTVNWYLRPLPADAEAEAGNSNLVSFIENTI
jgi:hypothetical protein